MAKNEWMISVNLVAGKTMYGVYRIRDLSQPDHSGNRETRGYWESEADAKRLAKTLNEEAKR